MKDIREVTDNELIGEFMGWRNLSTDSDHPFYYHSDPPIFTSKHQGKLYFDTSWDWLMPVVEKIQMFAHVKIENTQCMISVNGTVVSGAYNGSNIENVHKAVIDYIKWAQR